MPEYRWRAAGPGGAVAEGRLSAADPAEARRQLREQGLVPVALAPADAMPAVPRPAPPPAPTRRARPVGAAEVLALSSELSIMIKAGLSLDRALRVLGEMNVHPGVQALVGRLLEDVKRGLPFSAALAQHPALFGDFYLGMVRSGEASGQLGPVLERLVDHLERVRALREQVGSALMYPAVLVGVAAVSMIAMLGFVVPQFEPLFADLGDALPLPTQLIMALAQGFRAHAAWLGPLVLLAGLAAGRWARSLGGRRRLGQILARLPGLGRLALRYETALFCRSLGTLLGHGVPMVAALGIACETVGQPGLRAQFEALAPRVKAGEKFAQAAQALPAFEPLALNLIRVGDETGRLAAMLVEVAVLHNRDVELGLKRLLVVLEPILILVIGLMVAAIIVAILLGILSVNDLAA